MLFWGGDYTPLAHHLTFGEPGSLVTLLCRYPFFSGSVWLKMMKMMIVPRLPKTLWGGIWTQKINQKTFWKTRVVYPNKNWRIVLVMCVVFDLFVKVLLEDVVVFSGNRLGILWVDTIFLLLVDQEKCYTPPVSNSPRVFFGVDSPEN